MGIHYNYKSKRGERAMAKAKKRKDKQALRRSKRAPETRDFSKKTLEYADINKVITLDDLTNPDDKS